MILLDTDHLTALKYEDSAGFAQLSARMLAQPDETFAATVISFEEQMRGWLSVVARWSDPMRQVAAYGELAKLNDFHSRWLLVEFDERAARECVRLRRLLPRIGTMDLKIASIALTHDALLLTANARDLQTGLRRSCSPAVFRGIACQDPFPRFHQFAPVLISVSLMTGFFMTCARVRLPPR